MKYKGRLEDVFPKPGPLEEALAEVQRLIGRGQYVLSEEIPELLRLDFQLWMVGRTCLLKEGKPLFYHVDLVRWYEEIMFGEGVLTWGG